MYMFEMKNEIKICTRSGGGTMSQYEVMYYYLFNAVTDALREIEAEHVMEAKLVLIAAQQH